MFSKKRKEVDVPSELIEKIKDHLPKILDNPIMKEFLEVEENALMFKEMLENANEENVKKVNKNFKEFYQINKIIRYITGLIKRYSIDYDKRVKKRNQRFLLIMDKPINNEKGESNVAITMGDVMVNNEITPEETYINKEEQKDHIFLMKSESLAKSIKRLNKKQQKILYLYYEKGLNNKEIGEVFGQTEQNISYWHKKTLKELKAYLNEK